MLTLSQRVSAALGSVFKGWWVLGELIIIQILTASFTLQAFSAYVTVMQSEFGWSRTAFAAAFSIQQAGSGIIGPFQGWLIQRFGAKGIIRIGLITFAGGLMLLSTVNTLSVFYLTYVVIALGASFAGFLSLNAVAVQWFEKYRSTAFAFMQMGISLGGLLVPVIAWSLETYGWRATAFATALLVLVVGVPVTFLIGNRPEDYGLRPDGRAAPPAQVKAAQIRRDFTTREALQTRAFWLISFGHASALMVVFGVLSHVVVHLTSGLEFSLALAARLVALMTFMSVVGQFLGGILGDRVNKRYVAIGAMFGHAAGLMLLANARSVSWVVAFAIVHGLSWGLRGPIMQAIRADYFGRTSFAQILGISNVIVTSGTIIGPLVAGLLADMLGDYRIAFMLLAAVAALGSIFFILAVPPNPKTTGSAPGNIQAM
jgi:sugar phosphate permease